MQFDKYNPLMPIWRSLLPKGLKVFTTTWAMKLKSNRTCHRRLHARGYEQGDGSHHASDFIASPVTNPITVWSTPMLYYMNPAWMSAIIDVEWGFHQGQFENSEELYVEVPDGFKEWYQGNVMLRMNISLYGTNQAKCCSFFKAFAKHIKNMTYKQSKADPSCVLLG